MTVAQMLRLRTLALAVTRGEGDRQTYIVAAHPFVVLELLDQLAIVLSADCMHKFELKSAFDGVAILVTPFQLTNKAQNNDNDSYEQSRIFDDHQRHHQRHHHQQGGTLGPDADRGDLEDRQDPRPALCQRSQARACVPHQRGRRVGCPLVLGGLVTGTSGNQAKIDHVQRVHQFALEIR